MADHLVVDIDGLKKFTEALHKIAGVMAAAPAWINGDIGAHRVDAAVEHFESHWSDGRTRVIENCKKFGEMTKQAIEKFPKTDEDLANSLKEGS
jgi:hypothetical protein